VYCVQIGLREVFETRSEIQLVLELVTGGELFERIVERGHYSEQDAASAVRQILAALEVCMIYFIYIVHYLQHDSLPSFLRFREKKMDLFDVMSFFKKSILVVFF
jgi:serine/threonine protein kinase